MNDEINGQDSASISYRSADIIGQVERLKCSIVALLNELGRARIELKCESHSHACETPGAQVPHHNMDWDD
jgi:hypothetical protein